MKNNKTKLTPEEHRLFGDLMPEELEDVLHSGFNR
ncbi:MAG: ferredoxin, partial [Flavobacterium sp.]